MLRIMFRFCGKYEHESTLHHQRALLERYLTNTELKRKVCIRKRLEIFANKQFKLAMT